jgi:hypothetical protein
VKVKVGVQIGLQHGGDFGFAGPNMNADSLVLQQLQPLPRLLFVRKEARELARGRSTVRDELARFED